jgi:predicted CoA-substrate-specific enzyme activase
MYLGIDIGSSSSKAVVIDCDGRIKGSSVVNVGTGSKGPKKVLENVLNLSNVRLEEIEKTVVTGYGRMTYQGADKQITEISCHAKGVIYLVANACTIIDVGGQDAKVIRLNQWGGVENFVMNDKCAAGTGRFLEVMARVLDCSVDDLSLLAKKGSYGVQISSTCTVFAESEMISQLASGKSIEDIALGAHRSIAQRIVGLANRIGISKEVVMTGGVALNQSVVDAIEIEIGLPVVRLENPQVVGALGAALFARELA